MSRFNPDKGTFAPVSTFGNRRVKTGTVFEYEQTGEEFETKYHGGSDWTVGQTATKFSRDNIGLSMFTWLWCCSTLIRTSANPAILR